MRFDRRQFLSASAGVFVAGCARTVAPPRPTPAGSAPHVPLNISPEFLERVTVCTRPFRPTGPRLEAEAMSGKKIVHNYGHGGSGWSLSWGCADEAAALALTDSPKQVAVIGAGAMGLTTALRLAEHGAQVTIYAKEFPAETRSARASGVWSPSSRIGLSGDVDSEFVNRWEGWTRSSFARHSEYIGTPGNPIETLPQYWISGGSGTPRVAAERDYLRLDGLVSDIVPRSSRLAPEGNPFPVGPAGKWQSLVFNVADYAERLVGDFTARSGKMVRRDFPDRAAILALSEPVIVNCTGYGAKVLWDDQSLVPVRGQIAWFPAQARGRYGVYYKNVFALSRRDGTIVQYLGPNNDWGYGDASEAKDWQESRDAIETLAPLFP